MLNQILAMTNNSAKTVVLCGSFIAGSQATSETAKIIGTLGANVFSYTTNILMGFDYSKTLSSTVSRIANSEFCKNPILQKTVNLFTSNNLKESAHRAAIAAISALALTFTYYAMNGFKEGSSNVAEGLYAIVSGNATAETMRQTRDKLSVRMTTSSFGEYCMERCELIVPTANAFFRSFWHGV